MDKDRILPNSPSPRDAVHSIDHFALEVPNLTVARHFFDSFGLDVSEEANGLALRTTGNEHVWGRLFEGPRKRMAYLCLNAFEDGFPDLMNRVRRTGAGEASLYPKSAERAVWLSDPDGNLLKLQVGPKTSPSTEERPQAIARAAGARGVHGRALARRASPTRLSHVLLFTPDVERQLSFYQNVLGLGLSDRSQDVIAFTHGRHGSDHHLVAFAKSPAKGWHHCAWDVPTQEDVGLGWMQMQQAGYSHGWGMGRHVLGSNYFRYVEDPWGSFCEYSADMDFVPPDANWNSADHRLDDSLYLWGPAPPENFIHNTEAFVKASTEP